MHLGQEYTNRAYIDLEDYADDENNRMLVERLKRHPNFLTSKGRTFFFAFRDSEERDYFMITSIMSFNREGYEIATCEMVDEFEVQKRRTDFFRKQRKRRPVGERIR